MRRTAPLAAWILPLIVPLLATAGGTSFAKLITGLDGLRAEHGVPGFALTVLSEEHGSQTAAGGVADRASGRPVTPDTLFRIGSITTVYSNANAGLVGLVIERVSGQRYQRFIRDRLLGPMGMRTASLSDDELTRKQLATGYDTDGRTPIPYWHMIFPPLGAINATPREMAALLELFLRYGQIGDTRLLKAASIRRMERPATTLGARHGLTFGYGAGLDQSLRNGSLWHGHTGDGDGYLSYFGYNREARAGYFLTINALKHDALAAMRGRVEDALIGGRPSLTPPKAEIDAETLRPLVGTYVAVTRRFAWQDPAQLDDDRLQVVLEDGALCTRSGKGRRRLIAVDTHLFRREEQPLATIAIVPYDGELYLQAEFGNYRRVTNK